MAIGSERVLRRSALAGRWPRRDIQREWLVTNGLGGFASGTVDGVFTRRYHGLLIAALPVGRTMMLNGLSEWVRLPDGSTQYLGVEELVGVEMEKSLPVSEFRLENGLPVWLWETDDFAIEKRLVMPYRQNTVHVVYRALRCEGKLELGLHPTVHFRAYDAPVSTELASSFRVELEDGRCEICVHGDDDRLRMTVHSARVTFTYSPHAIKHIEYPTEESRGYESKGSTWCPGFYTSDIEAGESVCLIASTEAWEAILAFSSERALEMEVRRREGLLAAAPEAANSEVVRDLVLAADQFLITPASRTADATYARAEGEEAWTVIAGYHWFTDWGRDTMISLEGLALCTGRAKEARWVLRTFAHYVRDGLIPNLFPDGDQQGLYHTADASLWFFHALSRYLNHTDDRETLRAILPKLLEIADAHIAGTRFGIGVDPKDDLLRQGAEGYQLTWMDAKVDDWVVTPRRGKAVEINALWYNALCLLAEWLKEEGEPRGEEFAAHAERARQSFNARFWLDRLQYLSDVIDGDQADVERLRPNQILAISLEHPVLDQCHWEAAMQAVRRHLLTPVGLRTLAPEDPDYKPQYFGDLRARDAAYHQGTAWPWLIGPFIDAWLRVYPGEMEAAHAFLAGFPPQLDEACVGSINEIFDGDAPCRPRGCIAQAWSVAEVLRAWLKTTPAGEGRAKGEVKGAK